jgi:hypothetical protein
MGRHGELTTVGNAGRGLVEGFALFQDIFFPMLGVVLVVIGVIAGDDVAWEQAGTRDPVRRGLEVDFVPPRLVARLDGVRQASRHEQGSCE